MSNPLIRVPTSYRGGKMYTDWARIWPPLSWKNWNALSLWLSSSSTPEYTLRAYTAILDVTNLAADDLQDPRLLKIILKKVSTKPSIAPTSTSLVYLLAMWKLMKFNLCSHEQGPSQLGTLGFRVDHHLQCTVIKISFGIYHLQGERQDSAALVNLRLSQRHCWGTITMSCVVPKLWTSVRNSNFYFLSFKWNGLPIKNDVNNAKNNKENQLKQHGSN